MKTQKILFKAAIILIILGVIIGGVKLFRVMTQTETLLIHSEVIEDSFENISIDIDTDDITIESSKDDKCHLETDEFKDLPHETTVVNNTLTIKQVSKSELFKNIEFGKDSPKLKLYLPKKSYKNLYVNGDLGNVTVSSEFTFGDVTIKIDTGNIKLSNVVAHNKFEFDIDVGNITMDNCDAEEITAEVDTGNVKGSLRSDKVFNVRVDVGSVSVPDTNKGGRCDIKVDAGNVKITIK